MSRILCINTGSTSTKVGIFENEEKVMEKTLRHSENELKDFKRVTEQFDFRMEKIKEFLDEENIDPKSIDAIGCRGGLIKPIPGGTYLVDDVAFDLFSHSRIDHPCNLATLIGKKLADEIGIKAYFVDSPSTYELEDIATVSGMKEIKRKGNFHALNQKAIARLYAKENNTEYEDLKLIVAHLGGGMSIGVHKYGLVVDTTDGDEEGPFTPDRTGILPNKPLIDMCFSGKYTCEEMKKKVSGKGGLVGYLGTNDVVEVLEMSKTNDEAKLVMDAMIYQISKDICSMSAVLCGEVDAILITGGIAYSDYVTGEIEKRVGHIAKVKVYPGERELEALAEGVVRVLEGGELKRL